MILTRLSNWSWTNIYWYLLCTWHNDQVLTSTKSIYHTCKYHIPDSRLWFLSVRSTYHELEASHWASTEVRHNMHPWPLLLQQPWHTTKGVTIKWYVAYVIFIHSHARFINAALCPQAILSVYKPPRVHSHNQASCFLFFIFRWDCSLNSGFHACKTGALLLESHF
jgi:hypothetical protein